jgi:hypothetical protein
VLFSFLMYIPDADTPIIIPFRSGKKNSLAGRERQELRYVFANTRSNICFQVSHFSTSSGLPPPKRTYPIRSPTYRAITHNAGNTRNFPIFNHRRALGGIESRFGFACFELDIPIHNLGFASYTRRLFVRLINVSLDVIARAFN